jgi:hypothetical protein
MKVSKTGAHLEIFMQDFQSNESKHFPFFLSKKLKENILCERSSLHSLITLIFIFISIHSLFTLKTAWHLDTL